MEELNTLKLRLVAEDDLSEIWMYFSRNLDMNDKFMELGFTIPSEGHALADIVANVGALILRQSGIEIAGMTLDGIRQVSIPEHHFIHGVAMLRNHIMRFFYFEDIEVGMLYVHIPDSDQNLARLTGKRIMIQ